MNPVSRNTKLKRAKNSDVDARPRTHEFSTPDKQLRGEETGIDNDGEITASIAARSTARLEKRRKEQNEQNGGCGRHRGTRKTHMSKYNDYNNEHQVHPPTKPRLVPQSASSQ